MSVCAQCGHELGVGRFCTELRPRRRRAASDRAWHPRSTTGAPAPPSARPSRRRRAALPVVRRRAPAHLAPARHRHAGARPSRRRPGRPGRSPPCSCWPSRAAGCRGSSAASAADRRAGASPPATTATPTPTRRSVAARADARARAERARPTPSPRSRPRRPSGDAGGGRPRRHGHRAGDRAAQPGRRRQPGALRGPQHARRGPGDDAGGCRATAAARRSCFELAAPTTLTSVGLVNGYAKTAQDGGTSFDWYAGNRRVLAVEWVFDDGTVVRQDLDETRDSRPWRSTRSTTETVELGWSRSRPRARARPRATTPRSARSACSGPRR